MSVFSNQSPRSRAASDAYVAAVLALVGTRDPGGILEESPAVLDAMLADVPSASRTRPEAPGKWSVAEVIQHLADAELAWGYRLRRVLTEESPLLEGYDQDRWASRFRYAEAEPSDSLTTFTVLRRANLRLIRLLGPSDLERIAHHAERGELTLDTLLRLHAGHDLLHQRQIERIGRGVASRGSSA